MIESRVTLKDAAKELGMSELTVRGLMKQGKLPIGCALKHDKASKWSFFIYRKPLDEVKKQFGIGGGGNE